MANVQQRSATAEERQRVLDAIARGDPEWLKVAASNGIKRTAAYELKNRGQVENKKRGGVRQKCVKVTPEIMTRLEEELENNPSVTLLRMKDIIYEEYDVDLHVSTISRHLIGLTYTMKQTRMEKDAMNNIANKRERREFAITLEAHRAAAHRAAGDMIVYCDETNYNVYVARQVGRAKCGARASTVGPISQGKNLQIQLAVSNGMGVVEVNYVLNKIDMDMNASFLLDTFISALGWADENDEFRGKKVVLVLDNAPAHERSEDLLSERLYEYNPPLPADRLVTLRLAPYSPMCNPIEGCFSAMKSDVKNFIAEHRERLRFQPPGETHEGRKQKLLLEAAEHAMPKITPRLVVNEEIHSAKWWAKAKNMEDMRLGE